MGLSILDAALDVANLRFATEEEAKRRLEICRACDRFNRKLQTCEICFCVMPAKVKLLNSTCAMGTPKW